MIQLTDNCSKTIRVTKDSEDIRLFANQSVESLVNSNPGLLVYPQCLDDCDDDLKKQFIISEYESVGKDQQRYMHLSTGNLVGFIGTPFTDVSICSRFTGNDGLGHDCFLHYMLQRVLSVNIFNLEHGISAEEQAFDFLLLLFPTFLKDAIAQGVYKEYMSVKRNDANVKGVIDISRHINRNIPFKGSVSYNSREISYDNNVTQLVRHTIEFIAVSDFGKSVLSSDRDTIEAVNQIKSATPSYVRNNRLSVIRENSKPVSHPFYTKYTNLQKLCLRILRHQKMKYGSDDSKISGILFDASWLWEEYLSKLLKSYNHPQNRKGTGRIYLAENNALQRYPDFYNNNGVVLDAKYKHNISRDDEHQVISYMYRLKSRIGGFILPRETDDSKVSFSLLGYGNKLMIHYLQIPQHYQSYKEFSMQMNSSENRFSEEVIDL